MKPEFSNAFGIAKKTTGNGQLSELQIDYMLQYMESQSSITPAGPVSASAQRNEKVASVLLSREGVFTLLSLLRKTLGEEFDEIIAFLENQDEEQ